MKCAIHQDQDAIAFCRSCGNALCPDCRISIAGIAYCQTCLDAGRVRTVIPSAEEPEERPPTPTGTVTSGTRRNFLFGLIGMVILAVSIHIIWIYPYFTLYTPSLMSLIPHTVGLALLAGGITLCGFAFDEFKNYFNYSWGFYVGILTILSPWWLLIGDLLVYTGLVFIPDPAYPYRTIPGPLAPAYNIMQIVGSIFLGVIFILWPAVLLSVRKKLRSRPLTITASVFFLITAHILLLQIPFMASSMMSPYYFLILPTLNYYHAISIEPAAIITAVIINRLRLSIKP